MPRPLPVRTVIGPRGRRLDPSRPLYAVRRLSAGFDAATGARLFVEPGTEFDAKAAGAGRTATLFRARYIAHERPFIAPAQEPADELASAEVLSPASGDTATPSSAPPAPADDAAKTSPKAKAKRAGA